MARREGDTLRDRRERRDAVGSEQLRGLPGALYQQSGLRGLGEGGWIEAMRLPDFRPTRRAKTMVRNPSPIGSAVIYT
jgi:hypothetical protein